MPIDPKMTMSDIAGCLGFTSQAIHKRMKQFDVKVKKYNSKYIISHDAARALMNKQFNQLKLAVSVVKGGVGKTTIAEALAIRMALYGVKVLCIDVDQQANLTKGFGMDEKAKQTPVLIDLIENKAKPKDAVLTVFPGLDLIPSRLDNVTLDGYMMVNRVIPSVIFNRIFGDLFKEYELIIFDCPPTLGLPVCSAMLTADLVISPLNPDIYSYEGIEIMSKEFVHMKDQFGKETEWKILLNRFDSKTILSTDYIEELIGNESAYSERLFKSVIRSSQDFPNAKKKGKSIFDTFRKSTAKEDIDSLAREILAMMIHENPTKRIEKEHGDN